MTIKNLTFTILSKGNNDVIDMTSKIQDIISTTESPEGLVYISSKEENIGLVLIENNMQLIKKFISTVENITDNDTLTTLEDMNLNNKLKNQFIKNNLTLDFSNRILNIKKNHKIFMIDFNYGSGTREITTTILY